MAIACDCAPAVTSALSETDTETDTASAIQSMYWNDVSDTLVRSG
jgi:hypothetical protein